MSELSDFPDFALIYKQSCSVEVIIKENYLIPYAKYF